MKELLTVILIVFIVYYVFKEVTGAVFMGLVLVIILYAANLIATQVLGFELPWKTPPSFERVDENWEEYKEDNFEYREFKLNGKGDNYENKD